MPGKLTRQLVERSGVDDWSGRLIAAKDHQQIGSQGRLALTIELNHALLLQPSKSELDHSDGVFHDAPSRRHCRACLLPAQHRLTDEGDDLHRDLLVDVRGSCRPPTF